MKVTQEELAAYADGELEGDEAARVVLAVAADPELMRMAERHRKLRAMLGAEFAPILKQEVPERLTALLRRPGEGAMAPKREPETEARVLDLTEVRRDGHGARGRVHKLPPGQPRRRAGRLPLWGWLIAPVLAAALALAVVLPRRGEAPRAYAGARLAQALEEQLVATQPADAHTRILASFRAVGGDFCRAFVSPATQGIACRDEAGWKLAEPMADSGRAALLARARAMAAGPVLDDEAERAARGAGWRQQSGDPPSPAGTASTAPSVPR